MKSRGPYEIHALIGRCHLHYKKRASFSVTLKIGNKASASTQFKYPVGDEINFNTQLILKIDRAYFQGPGKLSIIVTMVTQEQQKKIIGSCITQFRQKGMQSCKISQCSCNQQGLEVMVEFEVVNIQNQNNNLNNNKFLSPNNSEMKDLKKTLTISREKQLVKSSRIKPTTSTKSGAEKTQVKVTRQNKDKISTDGMSPNVSSLTTKISSPQIKLHQQTKNITPQFRNRIIQLESKLKTSLNNQILHRKQVQALRNEMQILRKQNECLIEILKFEQEKSSAAISYISYMSKQINIQLKEKNQVLECLQVFQTIKLDSINDSSTAIKINKNKQVNQECILQINPICQKQENNEQTIENYRLLDQIQDYRQCIEQLRQKVKDLESADDYKNQSISMLEETVSNINKQNDILKNEIQKLQAQNKKYQSEINCFKQKNTQLQQNIAKTQKSLKDLTNNYQLIQEKLKIQLQSNSNLKNQKTQLKNQLAEADKKINQLKQYQEKYQSLLKQHDKLKNSIPKTPLASQIYTRKSRFQDGQEIENLINEMNKSPQQNQNKDLLIASRQVSDKDPFLIRNKSESLLKDMEIDLDSEAQNTQQTSKQICRGRLKNQQDSNKINRKISIPEPVKQPQKYNYQYDVDSLNYFNNFEEGHDVMELEGPQQIV